jgi:hypothetical protein
MKYLIIAAAAFTMGCTTLGNTLGTYAGMDLSMGYAHQFGQDKYGGTLAAGNGQHRGALSWNGQTDERDLLGVGVTVLIRKDK